MAKKRPRPIRTVIFLLVFLGAAFGGLAYLANPEPEKPAPLVEDQRPLADVLARMSEDKVKDPSLGSTSIRAHTEKMKASLAEPDFLLGPFSIGMTYLEFLGATAGHNKIIAVDSGVMGVYNILPDRFNVYFRKAEDTEKAYRLSYHRDLGRRSAQEVREYLVQIWGKATKSTCDTPSDQPAQDCVMTWWPVNGVRLEAKIVVPKREGTGWSDLKLRVDAYDDQAGQRDR